MGLDRMLMRANGDSSTRFTSVSDIMDGKVKTFGLSEHIGDEHFRAIFTSGAPGGGRELTVSPDVEKWIPPRAATGIAQTGNGGSAAGSQSVMVEDINQVLLDKTVVKLKARISTYNKLFSAIGKNVAVMKSDVSKSQTEIYSQVHQIFNHLHMCFIFTTPHSQGSAIEILTAENATNAREFEILRASNAEKVNPLT